MEQPIIAPRDNVKKRGSFDIDKNNIDHYFQLLEFGQNSDLIRARGRGRDRARPNPN